MQQVKGWLINTDGGCRDNPGAGAWAFVITKETGEVEQHSGFIPFTTNNQAEYRGFLMACQHVLTLPVADLPTTIQFISDSQLAVKQLGFEWAVKDENLLSIFRETRDLLSMIEAHCSVTLTHVKREENKLADLICNQVQDAHGVVSSKKGIKKS